MTDVWRHKKRGTVYEIITQDASLQCAALPDVELTFADETFAVYRNLKTGAIYVRPTKEFMDGRFERTPQENADG